MNLVSTRIITADVAKLVEFYRHITEMPVVQFTPDFAELQTQTATLAIGNTNTLQFFGGEAVAEAANNRTAIIEFLVKDVDAAYERLSEFLKSYLVQKPTTKPWGNRSLLFRDPDGNLVNLFTPTSPESMKRFEGKI